jgi:hypothetical protein
MNLYSTRKFLASMLALACLLAATAVWAQKRKGHKLRATAVVEVTMDSTGIVATRVIPVTILDDGFFQDASTYKASPHPMALENGIVYEAQTAGTPVGTATITSGASSKDSWTALGKWQIVTAMAKKTENKPQSVTTDDRPMLHRGAGSDSPSSAPSPSDTPAASGSGNDRPTLHRPDSSSNAPAPSSSPTPASSDDRPTLHRPENSTASDASASSTSGNQSVSASEDPDRPTLKRHDSTGTEPQPAQAKATSAPAAASKPARKPMTIPGTKTYAAVSDTQPTDIRSFVFQWKAGEEEAIEPKMRKLALEQLPKGTAPLTLNSFKNVVMRSFDLDLSNDAVIVFSGEISDAPAATTSTAGTKSRVAKETPEREVTRYVTVVARVDFEGEPQKVLASVTDSSRLDVTPRLQLIDAVDVDGDGNAELLFRQYGYDDKSFVIYSVGRSTVNKLFEGASTPLR